MVEIELDEEWLCHEYLCMHDCGIELNRAVYPDDHEHIGEALYAQMLGWA